MIATGPDNKHPFTRMGKCVGLCPHAMLHRKTEACRVPFLRLSAVYSCVRGVCHCVPNGTPKRKIAK